MPHDTLAILAHKSRVDAHLTSYLLSLRKAWNTFPWAEDTLTRIAKFAVAGKSVRGSLVPYSYTLFQKEISAPVWDAAIAMELFQAGLLIHDDIMDEDLIRRGMPSLHSQYEQLAASQKGNDIAHFGVSQAINIADLCYFLGYRLLSSAGDAIVRLVSTELSMVALAQMQDVASGHLTKPYDKEDVLNLYRTKTARYTFSLPMRTGAMLAGADGTTQSALERLGECLGMLYQIRDDEMNAVGNTAVTGKSVGSDAANNKQTLATVLSPEELQKLRRQLRIQAVSIIRALPVAPIKQQELTRLLAFCEERKH